MVALRAYKSLVGCISCRCGTKVSSSNDENPDLPRYLKTKTLRAWLPKEDNKLAGVGTKSSPIDSFLYFSVFDGKKKDESKKTIFKST